MDQGVRPVRLDVPSGVQQDINRALLDYDVLAAEHVGWDEDQPLWRYWACIPPWEELSPDVRAALIGSPYCPDGIVERAARADTEASPTLTRWMHCDAPIPVVELVESALPLLARPVSLPMPVDPLVRDLET